MTREELIAEIQVLHAYSQTWTFKNADHLDKTRWQMYCTKLFSHYLSDKDEISKADLKPFDIILPEFSVLARAKMHSKEWVIEDCREELKRLYAKTDLIDDKWLYSYDSTTGEVECLNIIVRETNRKSERSESAGNVDISTDYNLFKEWLFTTLTKRGQISGVERSIYYIDSNEWKIIKENFPKMVSRITAGSTDICTFKDYYRMKKREKALETFISKVEADNTDSKYAQIPTGYVKFIAEG